MYPPYLVVATSAMGLALARRLAQWRLIHWPCYQFMNCLYVGKLAMLVLPEARMALPVSLLLLVATPPLFIPMRDGLPDIRAREALPSQREASGTLDGVAHAAAPPSHKAQRAAAFVAMLLFAMQLGCVAIARLAIFDSVAALWGGPPPEGVLLCALLATAAAAPAPMVYRWFPHSVV
jgi:hypothetical protein